MVTMSDMADPPQALTETLPLQSLLQIKVGNKKEDGPALPFMGSSVILNGSIKS